MAIPPQKRRTAGSYSIPRYVMGQGFKNAVAVMARMQRLGSQYEPQNPQTVVGMLQGQANTPNLSNATGVQTVSVNVPLFGINMPLYAKSAMTAMLFPVAVYGTADGSGNVFTVLSANAVVNAVQGGGQGLLTIVIPTGTFIKSFQAAVTITGRWSAASSGTHNLAVSVGGLVLSVLSLTEQGPLSADQTIGSGTQRVPVVPSAS